jgi:hypothetical protein
MCQEPKTKKSSVLILIDDRLMFWLKRRESGAAWVKPWTWARMGPNQVQHVTKFASELDLMSWLEMTDGKKHRKNWKKMLRVHMKVTLIPCRNLWWIKKNMDRKTEAHREREREKKQGVLEWFDVRHLCPPLWIVPRATLCSH